MLGGGCAWKIRAADVGDCDRGVKESIAVRVWVGGMEVGMI